MRSTMSSTRFHSSNLNSHQQSSKLCVAPREDRSSCLCRKHPVFRHLSADDDKTHKVDAVEWRMYRVELFSEPLKSATTAAIECHSRPQHARTTVPNKTLKHNRSTCNSNHFAKKESRTLSVIERRRGDRDSFFTDGVCTRVPDAKHVRNAIK